MAFPKLCPICGPKLSICCLVLSAWGIIFLGILGIFFYIESAGLFEDIGMELEKNKTESLVKMPVEEAKAKIQDYLTVDVPQKYHSVAYNCWIATGLYVVTFIVALWQHKWNDRISTQ